MFETSHPFTFFDYYRLPYRVAGLGDPNFRNFPERHPLRSWAQTYWDNGRPPYRVAYWFREESSSRLRLLPGLYRFDAIPIYGRVVSDRVLIEWLKDAPGWWKRDTPILNSRGSHVASVWRDERGNRLLPFDPNEILKNFWTEGYRTIEERAIAAQVRKRALHAYYRLRPWLPYSVQIRLRQLFVHLQTRQRFPGWPLETALHDLYAWLFEWFTDLAQERLPLIAPWPEGYSWALALTHDVETQGGYRRISELKRIEMEAGYRSSWNFVPKRYPVEDALVQELVEEGFEVGVHGLYHDGRDLESLALLNQRLPAIRAYATRWSAVGFRSPSTHRRWEWMPRLGFDYDSSYTDTDPYEPQPGGCCSLLPFFNEDLVELPITLPQDHTLFVLLGHLSEELWIRKAQEIRTRHGMALLVVHPDYMAQLPVGAYRRFLNEFRNDSTAWQALPKEISSWWRRRAGSRVVREHGRWVIRGQATQDARIAFTPLPR